MRFRFESSATRGLISGAYGPWAIQTSPELNALTEFRSVELTPEQTDAQQNPALTSWDDYADHRDRREHSTFGTTSLTVTSYNKAITMKAEQIPLVL